MILQNSAYLILSLFIHFESIRPNWDKDKVEVFKSRWAQTGNPGGDFILIKIYLII
jgi:hypothetical protein